MIKQAYARIQSELESLLNDKRRQWLLSSLHRIKASQDVVNDLLTLSAAARRTLGQERLNPETEAITIDSETRLPINHWHIFDAGRALLIMQAVLAVPEKHESIVRSYFEQGDESEISALVRMAVLLDDAEKYKFYMREVGRTNSKSLYAALAQYNPYPARFYDDHEFNQLVLKALFIGIGIAPIVGLRKRANPELSKMCEDYIDERIAAGRTIPPDIWLALEPYASENGVNLIRKHLRSETPEHRYFSVKALQQQNPLSPERKQWLKELFDYERDARILTLLSTN